MHEFEEFPQAEPISYPVKAPGVDAAFCQLLGDRPEQQDACGMFPVPGGLLAVVADGMGGMAKGGAAARLAVIAAGREAAGMVRDATYDLLKAALERVNDDVYRSVESNGITGITGTTLCMALCVGAEMRLIWCGDSRAYLLRGGKLTQLTEDHIYERYLRGLVAEGVLSQTDAARHPSRNHLTGYVGMRELEDFSIAADAIPLKRGDTLLLCTDGLFRTLDARTLAKCMTGDAGRCAANLIGEAARLRRRGQDNATALVVKWSETCSEV